MHSLIFPYKLVNRRYIPIIPIILYGSRESKIRTGAFVDSGATFSIFNIELASSLLLNLRGAREQFFVVGDGSFIPARVVKYLSRSAVKRLLLASHFLKN